MGRSLMLYIAGKVVSGSSFGTTHWRDAFCDQLSELSGIQLTHIDPTKIEQDLSQPLLVFGADAYAIKQSDVVVAYLSDDISIGCSQEILIAKYYNKPVIGIAPAQGKFNRSTKEFLGKKVKNYKNPFVMATCDVVVETVREAADALLNSKNIRPKTVDLIKEYALDFELNHAKKSTYLSKLLEL